MCRLMENHLTTLTFFLTHRRCGSLLVRERGKYSRLATRLTVRDLVTFFDDCYPLSRCFQSINKSYHLMDFFYLSYGNSEYQNGNDCVIRRYRQSCYVLVATCLTSRRRVFEGILLMLAVYRLTNGSFSFFVLAVLFCNFLWGIGRESLVLASHISSLDPV